MDSSEAESDDFQSADEFVDEEDGDSKCTSGNEPQQMIVNNDTLENSIAIDSKISEFGLSSSDSSKSSATQQEISDRNQLDRHTLEVVAKSDEAPCPTANNQNPLGTDHDISFKTRSYRKKSERIKRPILSPQLTHKKSDTKPAIDIVNVARPDILIKDITCHLKSSITSGVSKGLSTFQETSSSLKGLVLGATDDSVGERFFYDEDRRKDSFDEFVVEQSPPSSYVEPSQSLLSDEILKLSDAFARLNADNSGRALSTDNAISISQYADLGFEGKMNNNDEDIVTGEVVLNSDGCTDQPFAADLITHEVEKNLGTIPAEKIEENVAGARMEDLSSTTIVELIDNKTLPGIVEKVVEEVEIKDVCQGLNLHDHNTLSEEVEQQRIEKVSVSPQFEEPTIKVEQNVESGDADGWDVWDEEVDAPNSQVEAGQSGIELELKMEGKKSEFSVKEDPEVANEGWDDWKDDDEIDELSEDIQESCLRSNDIRSPKEGTNESLSLEFKTENNIASVEISDSVVDNQADGWKNCESDEDSQLAVCSEKVEPNIVDEENVSKENTDDRDAECSEHGWGDWGDEDIDYAIEQEGNGEFQSVNKDKREDGWGNFEEIPSMGTSIAKKDEEGWGDWGDDDVESEASVKRSGNISQNCQSNSSEETLKDFGSVEWKGWDNFGGKKDEAAIGGWGISSFLNKATAVSSNISAITKGISSAIESGLGVPDPETMARFHKQEEEKRKDDPEFEPNVVSTESQLQFPFRNIAKIVEVAKVQEIGSRVLSGGLGTLETIGKKTMEVLQEGDPGLKKKRALLVSKGQTLSNVLRDARDQSAAEDKRAGEIAAGRRCHFETVFDDYQGLVHLEALEMLSTQCQLRIEQLIQSMPSSKTQELQDTLEEVKELCELDEDLDPVEPGKFGEALNDAVERLQNEFSVKKIIEVHDMQTQWLASEEAKMSTSGQLYDKAIKVLAELTASATQQFHKGGELLLLKERRKTVEEADCLLQLTGHLCSEITVISDQVVSLLQEKEENSDMLIENLRVEASNAVSYIKQALELMLPVIQLGAV